MGVYRRRMWRVALMLLVVRVGVASADRKPTSLGARLKADPVAVLRELGLSDDEFGDIADKLYAHWKTTHPENAPVPWWCFGDSSGGSCADSSETCERNRLAVLDADGRCLRDTTLDDAVAREMSERYRNDCLARRAKDLRMTACEGRAVAACFSSVNRLDGQVGGRCYPALSACKKWRAVVVKNLKDDEKITSDCKAR